MKLTNRILALLLLAALLLSLVGCVQCISVEYQDVDVVIVDEYYRAPYTTFIWSGKVMIPITNAAIYRITVQYNGAEYAIGGSSTYNKYKDKVGQTVMGKLEIKTYDDGTATYDIVSLE